MNYWQAGFHVAATKVLLEKVVFADIIGITVFKLMFLLLMNCTLEFS